MTNKLIKRPFAIYVVLLFLISLAVYSSASAYSLGMRFGGGFDGRFGGDIFNFTVSFIFFITAIFLYLNKTWSKVLIYLISIYYVVYWSFISFTSFQRMTKYDLSILDIFTILIPGSLMLFAWIGSCFVVTKYFNRISRPDRVIPL